MSTKSMRLKKIVKDEGEAKRLGICVKYICISSVCKHHKSSHGELFSFEKIMELYGVDNVSEDCRCVIKQILLDENGQPRTPGLVAKIKAQRK